MGLVLTCDAKEKLGPGDLFLLGAGGALLAAPPDWEPFRFRRLLAGRCDSEGTHRQATIITLTLRDFCCWRDILELWEYNKLLPATSDWKMWTKKGCKKEDAHIFSVKCSYYNHLPVFFGLGPPSILLLVQKCMNFLSLHHVINASKYAASHVRPVET